MMCLARSSIVFFNTTTHWYINIHRDVILKSSAEGTTILVAENAKTTPILLAQRYSCLLNIIHIRRSYAMIFVSIPCLFVLAWEPNITIHASFAIWELIKKQNGDWLMIYTYRLLTTS